MEKEWLTTVVDSYYNESEGYIHGDITHSSYTIPSAYKSELSTTIMDQEIQSLLVTQILPQELIASDQHSSHRKQSHSKSQHPYLELFVLKTYGDGDCLLHAISLGLWGKEDQKHYLRGLLSLTFSLNSFKEKILAYWNEEELYRDISLGFTAARDLNEITNEFNLVANIANEPGKYLEGIHVAALAHILRRPIICYSQETPITNHLNMTGQSLSGIYLPILHEPKDCCRTPLAIVYTVLGGSFTDGEEAKSTPQNERMISYHVGHFSAVIGLDYQHPTFFTGPPPSLESEESVGTINCFPLVSADLHFLPLRYCYTYDPETKVSSREDIVRRDQLIVAYLDFQTIPVSDSETRRSIPVAMARSRDVRTTERKFTRSASLPAASVVYNSKSKFFTEILESKRSELELLRAKMREVEMQIGQIEKDIHEADETELFARRQERSSLTDYAIMKREQERSEDLRRRSRELDRRRVDRSARDPAENVFRRVEAFAVEETPAPFTDTTRSTRDRAGTPKRVYPTRSPEKKPEPRATHQASDRSDFKYPSEERVARMRELGMDYYNGELMTIEEAQQLRKVMEISLQSSAKDETNNDDPSPLTRSLNEDRTPSSDLSLSISPALARSPILSNRHHLPSTRDSQSSYHDRPKSANRVRAADVPISSERPERASFRLTTTSTSDRLRHQSAPRTNVRALTGRW